MKRALLIGNGVNRLKPEESYSWGDLLSKLKDQGDFPVDLNNSLKPFPLAFDEVLHANKSELELKEKLRKLKKKIRESIERQLEHKNGWNEYHRKLVFLGYDDILTTNYDYSFQLSADENFFERKTDWAVNKQEYKHSLKRCYAIPEINTKIWHIHGELFDSRNLSDESSYYHEESIMIGYAHYVSYLNKINENIKGKSGNQEIDNQSLMVRLRDKSDSPFWTDILFTHDVDIIGQGLDFSENHLWWLINYRANSMRGEKQKHGVKINNKIRFYHPYIKNDMKSESSNGLDIDRKIDALKSKAVADLLKAFCVESINIECESYEDFYDKFIKSKACGQSNQLKGAVA
jgi:hypothetical protein